MRRRPHDGSDGTYLVSSFTTLAARFSSLKAPPLWIFWGVVM